jgi:hypothetical protein
MAARWQDAAQRITRPGEPHRLPLINKESRVKRGRVS